MRGKLKFGVLVLFVLGVCIVSIGVGSVWIPPSDSFSILIQKLFGINFSSKIPDTLVSILWEIRMPRVMLAFLSGGILSMSGMVMQSMLHNPLASSYTLGVSSGAALGGGFCILLKCSFFGFFTVQVFGFFFGICTVLLVLVLAYRLDKIMSSQTIILIGVSFSMFANAVLMILMVFAGQDLQQILFWQMGSFALGNQDVLWSLLVVFIGGFFVLYGFHWDLDLMMLGEEAAFTSGLDGKKVRVILCIVVGILTGSVVSVVGVIGFVDLFTPHIAKKLFGARHKFALPATVLLGGSFIVLCDLLARVLIPPFELPVGAVTALLGVPFFFYLYFCKKGQCL